MAKDQKQALIRVYRTSQTRPTHLFLLYTKGNPIERDILKRQQARTKVGEITWKVSTGDIERVQLAEERVRARQG